MFVKRARPRPSLRARDSDLPDPASTLSPLAKSSITANDAQNSDDSVEIDPNEGSGSILGRKKGLKKEKTKDRLSKKVSALSFGGAADEDEGMAFKPKKSLLSQQLKPPSTPSTFDTTGTPSTMRTSGVYSREYLSELKAATPTRAPRGVTDTIEDDDTEDPSGLSRLAREKYASTFAQDTTAGIPDAATIAAAKMKRQAAVGGNGPASASAENEEDYISLGSGAGKVAIYDAQQGPHPESRLMREEDEEGEGDEDLADYTGAKDKLFLGKNANKAAARRLRGEIGELIADREAEDEDDEETLEWEKAQAQRSGLWAEKEPDKVVKKGYTPAPIPLARPLPTIPSAQSRLTKALSDLEITKSHNDHNLDVVAQELADLEKQERELRIEVEKVEGKREYMEEFRRWVEMLGNFLEEKFPRLEEIEADALHIVQERSQSTNKRRADDDNDDLALCMGVAAPKEGEQKVDERDATRVAGASSGVRRSRREQRESRRSKRIARKANTGDDEGYSTDSTLADADAEDYAAAQNRLAHRTYALLDDVKAEDFRDPEKGLAVRFGGWRKRDEEEYVNAFGGLALVQAWEFWARGEMVGWEPLRGSAFLDSFRWFHSLHHYCHPRQTRPDEDEDLDEEPPLSPEGDLVASMVSTAVVPLLTKIFEAGAYDPYSAPQTRRAVDLTDVVADLTSKDSRKFVALLKAILAVFHSHLLELSSAIIAVTAPDAIPPPAFNPASRSALSRFIHRRIKLLKNILMWKREAPQEVRGLVVRLVGEILRPVLSRTWESGGKELAQDVSQSLKEA
ncbi:GC-rich sequence DNA-binding factor [Cryptococcus deuterogattii R265]|uniref:GC-rich sequence DNA-binding factor n=1 Tax=Cryptococcus deuterogattii (strain R265) TaxID=294750 RepID=UPI001936DC31|nr:GC-rich sequence DNA-binding factor [Cryptococcus deuterogattii R265]